MPIYEFSCDKCGRKFELLVSLTAGKKPACPKCGATKLSRLFSVFGVKSGSGGSRGGGAGPRPAARSRCGSCVSHSCSTCR